MIRCFWHSCATSGIIELRTHGVWGQIALLAPILDPFCHIALQFPTLKDYHRFPQSLTLGSVRAQKTKEQGTFAGIPDLNKVKQFNFLTVLSCLCYYHVKSLSWASTATELHGNKPPELCHLASALVHPQWYWSPQSLLMSPGPKG